MQTLITPIPTTPIVISPIDTQPIATTPIGSIPMAIMPLGATPKANILDNMPLEESADCSFELVVNANLRKI